MKEITTVSSGYVCYGNNLQGYQGFRAVMRGRDDGEVAAVQARYLSAQAQANAAAAGFGGEEGLEKIRHHLRRDAASVILDADEWMSLAHGYVYMYSW